MEHDQANEGFRDNIAPLPARVGLAPQLVEAQALLVLRLVRESFPCVGMHESLVLTQRFVEVLALVEFIAHNDGTHAIRNAAGVDANVAERFSRKVSVKSQVS